ncbi:MAG: 50S ribosomal protein L25 [Polyangiales bacterium]
MDFAALTADVRGQKGKGAARRLRHLGKIPAVAYGRTLASTPIAIDPAALVKILQGPQGLNTVMALKVEGGEKDLLVMVREFTHHPVTRKFLHADFIQVKLGEDVEIDVPFVLTGKAIGITAGGVLNQIYRKLPIRVRPDNIPLKIETDVTHLELGHAIKTQDLKLPEGVRVRLPAEQTVVAVVAPEKDRGGDEAAAVPGAAPGASIPPGAPAAKGAAAAPAAGAKGGAAAAPAKADAKPAAKKK